MKHPRTYIGLTIMAIVLALGAGFYYYRASYIPEKEAQLTMMSIAKSKPAIQSLYAGEYDSAIESLRSLIAQAPTRTDKARLQQLLMAALFDKGGDSNTMEAASLAYGIVNDYSVAPWVRAMAYNTISRVVLAHDQTFYQTYFNKSPFSDYANTQSAGVTHVQAAYLKILQVSDDIYPTSFAEYGIAGYYFMVSLNNTSQQTPEELATLMQKYVAEGDTRDDFILYAPYTIILDQLTRARAITLSNKILKNHPTEDSERAYKQVQATAGALQGTGVDLNNPKIQAVLLTWRFAYADFLLTVIGTTRTADIKSLLVPFGTVTSSDIIGLLEKGSLRDVSHLPPTDITVVRAKKLATVSPEFKAFLVRMGVTF
jgi:hypothetical protein